MMQVLIMLVCASVLVGCLSAWVVCFVRKWEVSEGCTIAEWLQIHGPAVVGEAVRCTFCSCWWVSVAVTLVLVLVAGEWILLVTPFFSTAIGRLLAS